MKILKLILIFICLSFCLCGCSEKEGAGILFNNEPINENNLLQSKRQFEVGKRIYYLFYSPKKIKAEFIRVQVFKAADNVALGGYSIIFTQEKRIMKQNMYYYYDNFTLHQSGRYVMQVFDVMDITKPLAWNYFYVY